MKNFKRLAQIFLLIQLLYLASCTDDGDDPTTSTEDARDDFLGLWSVQETSSIFGPSVYDSEISKHSSIPTNLDIDNFYHLGVEIVVQAIVDGNQLEIPTQTITGQVLEGTGQLIDKNTIQLNYTANDGAEVDTISCIYTKK